MNKVLGYRPRRATTPRGLRYRRRIDGQAFTSQAHAWAAAEMLARMTGEACDVVPSSAGRWFVVRAVGDRWERV